MPFKTVVIKDYNKNALDLTTKIDDGDIAFIIDEDSSTIHIWNGQRASMLNRYKAGMMAPAFKSAFHLYEFKTNTVEQGNESERLKGEINNLLNGKGTTAGAEEKIALETSIIEFKQHVQEHTEPVTSGDVIEKRPPLEKPASHVELEKLRAELDTLKVENETKNKDHEQELDALHAELEKKDNLVHDLQRDLEGQGRIATLEKEKLAAERDAAVTKVERIKEGLEDKVKYLELEITKSAGEREAVQKQLDDTRHYLENQIKIIEAERDAIKIEADKLENEKRTLDNDMQDRITELKKEMADKVKMNFYNIKQIPSAPTGSVWFESIVQVVSGDKAFLPANLDAARMKQIDEMQKRENKINVETKKVHIEKVQDEGKIGHEKKIEPRAVIIESEPPKKDNGDTVDVVQSEDKVKVLKIQDAEKGGKEKKDEARVVKKEPEPPKADNGDSLDFVRIDDKVEVLIIPDAEKGGNEKKEETRAVEKETEPPKADNGGTLDFPSLDDIEHELLNKKKGKQDQDTLNFD